MPRLVSQKMGIKAGKRAFLVNAPESALEAIELPSLEFGSELDGEFDYILFFTITQVDMNDKFPTLKSHLRPTGKLWVSWPKSKKLATDLTLPKVIHIGYNHGLVESTCLSVDATWSALKFTHPKEGKTYNNSHGQLPTA